jgi:hypothetical protein
MQMIEIGRLLRSNADSCTLGCWVTQLSVPQFGGMVRIPVGDGCEVYGLIYDIRVDDDGLVKQLISAGTVDSDVIQDNRINRNVPVEISVRFIGYMEDGAFYHLVPPRPPLTLDAIYPCTVEEACRFTSAGRFGYFRHLLRAGDVPVSELLAAHLLQVGNMQKQQGRSDWLQGATQELIILLRDDYKTLMNLLSALGDTGVFR